MKIFVTMLVSVLLFAACSSPKYAYNFDYYDYNSGKKKAAIEKENVAAQTPTTETTSAEIVNPLATNPESVVASAEASSTPIVKPAPMAKPLERKYTDLTKSEKKEFRKALKTEIKNIVKHKKDYGDISKDTRAMDYNLKMA